MCFILSHEYRVEKGDLLSFDVRDKNHIAAVTKMLAGLKAARKRYEKYVMSPYREQHEILQEAFANVVAAK